MSVIRRLAAAAVAAFPLLARAEEFGSAVAASLDNAIFSGLWLVANLSYAGMRAQDSPSAGWRIVAFIVGFPLTLVSFFAVKEGGERAYGVDIPKRRP